MWHSEILIQCLNNTLIVVEAGKNGPGGEKCFQGNSRKKEQRPGSGTTSVVEKMSYLHPGRSRGISLALCHSFGFFPARETVCAMSELFSAACPWRSAAGRHARRWKKAGGAVSLPGSSLYSSFPLFLWSSYVPKLWPTMSDLEWFFECQCGYADRCQRGSKYMQGRQNRNIFSIISTDFCHPIKKKSSLHYSPFDTTTTHKNMLGLNYVRRPSCPKI